MTANKGEKRQERDKGADEVCRDEGVLRHTDHAASL